MLILATGEAVRIKEKTSSNTVCVCAEKVSAEQYVIMKME